VQDFKAATARLLDCFVQDSSESLSGRRCESWARAAQFVDEMEPGRAAALADTVVSAVGVEHADKLSEYPFFHLATFFV